MIPFNLKSEDKQMDDIFDGINALMENSCWGFLDYIIGDLCIRAWNVDITLLMAILTSTLPAKNNIPRRKELLEIAKQINIDQKMWEGLD